jgi:ketosteroid isomerase-like protein
MAATELEARLRRLEDEAEIRHVVDRYSDGVRLRSPDLVLSCFTDDAVLDYGTLGTMSGNEAIRAFFTNAMQPGGRTPGDERRVSTPVMTNVVIEWKGDDEAHCESLCLAIHGDVRAGEEMVRVSGTRNLDDFVKTAQGWRIRRRVHTTEWRFETAGSGVEH